MLKTIIALNTDVPSPSPNLDALAGQTVAGVDGIRSVWMAPGGIVRSVYPLAGNAETLGRNVMEDERPAVRGDVLSAIQSRRITLSNQFDQKTDSRDWVAWLAVYNRDEFWGLVALKLDSTHLLQSLDPGDRAGGLQVALRDESGRLLYGEKSVFENDPVVQSLDRPEPGWELGAIPVEGWVSSVRGQLRLFEVAGLVVVLLLTGLVYLNATHQAAENTRLFTAAQAAAVLEERHRLAAELHDSVTQLIYSDVLLAEASRNTLASGDRDATDHYLARIGETAQQALKEMRLLLFELRHSGLGEDGLVEALQRRLDAVEKRVGVAVQMLADTNLSLPQPVQEELFRVASEALNNSLKHASATSVSIELRARGNLAELMVMDNGRGFDPDSAVRSGGLGLTTMRERVQGLGGSLVVDSAPGAGTVIRVTVKCGAIVSTIEPMVTPRLKGV